MACAACGRVLDYYRASGGWMHSIAAPEEDDHLAEPVPVDQVQVRARCDFCFADEVVWVVPARDFVVSPSRSMGDWAACDKCGWLIQQDRWNALLDRCYAGYIARHDVSGAEDEILAGIRRLHRALRKNITGSLRRI
jgi:hypothetical protein